MFYNLKTKTVTDFPDRELLEQRIRPVVAGLHTGIALKVQEFHFDWLCPVDHNTGEYLSLENTLRLLRSGVGNKEQGVGTNKHARNFLHQVKDSTSVGLATLYSRYARSLMANCLRRLNPSNDHVSMIQMGEYNVLYFANSDSDFHDDSYVTVIALLCPHVEPDWCLDDFCRRELQLYQHDLYGDRGRPSEAEYVEMKGLDELTDSELREYAYRLNTFANANAWRNMSRESTYALMYRYEFDLSFRPNMSMDDRISILSRRISEKNITIQEAFYWMRALGCNYATALVDHRREAYRSLLVTQLNEYLEHAG